MKQTAAIIFCSVLSVFGFPYPEQTFYGVPYSRYTALSTFTDIHNYNIFTTNGNPLGLLECEDASIKINAAYTGNTLSPSSNDIDFLTETRRFSAPSLLLGKPGTAYIGLNYIPAIYRSTSNDITTEITQQRFGLLVASSAGNGIIQMGLAGQGRYGVESNDISDNNRSYLGVDNFGIFIGSQFNEMARIGLFAKTAFYYDSLKDVSGYQEQDRFFSERLPVVGLDFDFGKQEFPVMADFSFAWAKHDMVYVTKPDLLPIGGLNGSGNKDALVGDSAAWRAQLLGDLKYNSIGLRPALTLAYSRSSTAQYIPSENNQPLSYGDAREGYDWTFKSFVWGAGFTGVIKTWGNAYVEFNHGSNDFSQGDNILVPDSIDQAESLNRFAAGIEVFAHGLPALYFPNWLTITLRAGFHNYRDNKLRPVFGPVDDSNLYELSNYSQITQYLPWTSFQSNELTTGFIGGLSTGLKDNIFELDLNFRADKISSSDDQEYHNRMFCVSVTYNLKKGE